MYHIGFVIEQALGHVTHGKNLQANVPQDPDIAAYWGLPAWEAKGIAGKLPLYKSNWTVRAGWQARRSVAKMNRLAPLDALFFHTQVTAVLSQDWIRRIPSIISLDATPLQYDALGEFYAHEPGAEWLERFKWRMTRNALRGARHVVTWSEWTKQGLVDEYEVPAGKITVIPPGVNVQDWLSPHQRQTHNNVVKILFVGGNLDRKGGTLLLEAFRALRQEANVELHLVTRDTVADEPGLFVYNDMQPNSAPLKRLYHDCDIFCLPTFGDCLPMVLSEAGAAGLPVVSTSIAAIPEIVQERETGFLVPTGDVPALTTALRQLVMDGDLRIRQGKQAVDVVSTSYDGEHNARRLLDLIKRVVDEAR